MINPWSRTFKVGIYATLATMLLSPAVWADRHYEIDISRDHSVNHTTSLISRGNGMGTENDLAYARRLYRNGDLDKAASVAADVAKGNPRLAAPALFLAGRINYTRGEHSLARSQFRKLYLGFPTSDPVRTGALQDKLTKAVQWQLDDGDWEESGLYVALLKDVAPDAAAQVLGKAEHHVRTQLSRVDQWLGSQDKDVSAEYRREVQENPGHHCEPVKACWLDNDVCIRRAKAESRQELFRMKTSDARVWSKHRDAVWGRLRRQWLRAVEPDIAQFHWVQPLISEAALLDALKPRHPPAWSPPYDYTIVTHDYSAYHQGWSKITLGSQPGRGWAVCRNLRTGDIDHWSVPELHFAKLDAATVLDRLGKLLHQGQHPRAAKPRHRL